jgi:hypothetical protein
MARAAWLLRPTVVLVENVPTVRHDVEEVLRISIDALKNAGYEVHDGVVDLWTRPTKKCSSPYGTRYPICELSTPSNHGCGAWKLRRRSPSICSRTV